MQALQKIFFATLLVFSSFLGVMSLAPQASAATLLENLGTAAREPFNLSGSEASTGESETSIGRVIGDVIKIILGFTGTIAFIVFLYGGFLWLTARGNDTQVDQAKKYLTNGVIGVVIIILAYSVTFFITDVLFEITT